MEGMSKLSDRAELDDDRYITDKGPACERSIADSVNPYKRCLGTMWLYVVQFPGHLAHGQCAKCHDFVTIDLEGPHPSGTTIAEIKAAHERKLDREFDRRQERNVQ